MVVYATKRILSIIISLMISQYLFKRYLGADGATSKQSLMTQSVDTNASEGKKGKKITLKLLVPTRSHVDGRPLCFTNPSCFCSAALEAMLKYNSVFVIFPDTGFLVPDVANIYLIGNDQCLYNCPPPRMFPPTDFLLEKRIELVAIDLYIIFTYYTQDNQQECFRPCPILSLWCLRPRMNHFPHVWWSKFRLMFLNGSW